jgi:hypothetical protein
MTTRTRKEDQPLVRCTTCGWEGRGRNATGWFPDHSIRLPRKHPDPNNPTVTCPGYYDDAEWL